MSVRHKALRGVFWSAAQNWGASLISTLVFFVLAHRLSKDAFGVVAVATACIGFMEIFLRQGFAHALIQRQDLKPGHIDTAFWANLVVGIAMLGAGQASASTLASVFDKPTLAPVIRWLSLGFVIGSLGSTQAAILRRELAFKVLAIRTLLATTIGGAVGVTMALLDYGVWSLVAQVLTTRSVAALVMWIGSSWRPGFAVSRARFRELFSFGAFVMGIDLFAFVVARVDVLVLGYFLTAADVGVYDVACKMLRIVTRVFTQSIASVTLPTFSRVQHDRLQLRNAYFTATQMTAVVAFPAFVGLALLAPEVVGVFFGSKWEPSIMPMRLLSLVGMLYAVFFCNQPLMFACGKPSWRFGLAAIQGVTQLIAVLIAVRWGVVAVAAAFVMRSYAIAPLSLLIIRKLIHTSYADYFRTYSGPCLASVIAGIAVMLLREIMGAGVWLPLRLGVLGLLGVGVYAAALRLFWPALVQNALALVRTATRTEEKASVAGAETGADR